MGSKSQSRKEGLELIKRVGNLRLEHLKRVYQRKSLVESYMQGVLHIHAHFEWKDLSFCGICRNLLSCDKDTVPQDNEVIVSVEISEDAEHPSPSTSLVWLQRLDVCDVGVIQSNKTTPSGFVESLWRIGDRKLRSLLSDSSIQNSKFRDQVIQSETQTIGRLASNDSDSYGNRNLRTGDLRELDTFSRRNIEFNFNPVASLFGDHVFKLDNGSFSVFRTDLVVENLEFREVFEAPIHLGVAAIERNHIARYQSPDLLVQKGYLPC